MAGIRADVSLNVNTTNVKRSLDKATNEINKTLGRINGRQVSFNVNSRSFTQPLGRITASANEFTKSLEASNARVIAFGASVGIINGVTNAFKGLVLETIRFEKTLQDINVVLDLSSKSIERFGSGLFDVARNTAQSFNVASEAALEFSRQGLSTEEVLKRTNDALTLTRLTSLDAAEAVAGLTAAVNAFGDAGLTTTDIIDKLAAVDVKFAVSSEDLINGLERAGAVAIDAGVELDSLVGLIAALQQTTARGGAVIGNSLKTIFTRIQRPESIRQIEDLGVAVRNIQGEVLSADKILLNMAKSFNTLTQAQQSNVVQFSAGIFQANVFRAILRDLSKEQSLQAQATEVSANASGEAARKNELLNKTLAALASQAGTGIRELAGIIGELAVKPEIGGFLEFFVDKIQDIKNLLGGGEDEGSSFAKGLVRGIGNVLTGPGVIAFGAVFIKMFVNIAKFASTSLKDVLGIVTQKERIAQMEQSIVQALSTNRNLQESLNNLEGDRLAQEKYILGIIEAQTSAMREQELLASRLAKPLLRQGVSPELIMTSSGGLIPEQAKAKERKGAARGGYAAGAIDSMNVPGVGPVVFNKAETVKQFPGMKQPAIMPPEKSKAGSVYRSTFQEKHGFDPYSSHGFIPNFATQRGSTLVMDKAKLKIFGSDVSIGKAIGKKYQEIQDHFDKKIPITIQAGLERIITSSDKSKKAATGKESLFNAFTALHARGIKSIERSFDIRSLGGLKSRGVKQGKLTKAEFTEKKVENLLKREGGYQRTEIPEINRGLSNYPVDLIAYGQNFPSFEVKSGAFDAANLILKSLRMASDRELPNWMQQNKISGGSQLKERNLKRAASLAKKLDLYDPKQSKSARQEGFRFGEEFADEWGLSQGLVPNFVYMDPIKWDVRQDPKTKKKKYAIKASDYTLSEFKKFLEQKGVPKRSIQNIDKAIKGKWDTLRQIKEEAIKKSQSRSDKRMFYDAAMQAENFKKGFSIPTQDLYIKDLSNLIKEFNSTIYTGFGDGLIPNYANLVYDKDKIESGLSSQLLKNILSDKKTKNLLIGPSGAGKSTLAAKYGEFIKGIEDTDKATSYTILSGAGKTKSGGMSAALNEIINSVNRSGGKVSYLSASDELIEERRKKRIESPVPGDLRSKSQLKGTRFAPKNQSGFKEIIEKAARKFEIINAAQGLVPNYAVTLSDGNYYSTKNIQKGISELYKKSGGKKLSPKDLEFAAERYISAVKDKESTYPGGSFTVGGKKFNFNEVSLALMKHGQFYRPKEGEAVDLSKDFYKGLVPNFAVKAIKNIIDGDSVEADVYIGTKQIDHRLKGVDAVEKDQAFGTRARTLASKRYSSDKKGIKLLDKTRVTDGAAAYNRGLFDDKELAKELVIKGYGIPDVGYLTKGQYREYSSYANQAMKQRRGIWGTTHFTEDQETGQRDYHHPKAMMFLHQSGLAEKAQKWSELNVRKTRFKGANKATYGYASGEGSKGKATYSNGLIPNFADPLNDAIEREKAAGIPESNIRIERSSELESRRNPMGLAVTNTRDEPFGVSQGIRRAKSMGIDPKTHGASQGLVPNFVKGSAGIKNIQFKEGVPDSVKKAYNESAKHLNTFNKNIERASDASGKRADVDMDASDQTAKFSEGGLMKLFIFQSVLSTANGFLQEFAETGNNTTKKIAEFGMGLSGLATTFITVKELQSQLMGGIDQKKDGVGLGRLIAGGGARSRAFGQIAKGFNFKEIGGFRKGLAMAGKGLLRFTPIVGQLITLGSAINEAMKFITGEGIFDLLKSDADKAADKLKELAEAADKTQTSLSNAGQLQDTQTKIIELETLGKARTLKQDQELFSLRTKELKQTRETNKSIAEIDTSYIQNEDLVNRVNQAKNGEIASTKDLIKVLEEVARAQTIRTSLAGELSDFETRTEDVDKTEKRKFTVQGRMFGGAELEGQTKIGNVLTEEFKSPLKTAASNVGEIFASLTEDEKTKIRQSLKEERPQDIAGLAGLTNQDAPAQRLFAKTALAAMGKKEADSAAANQEREAKQGLRDEFIKRLFEIKQGREQDELSLKLDIKRNELKRKQNELLDNVLLEYGGITAAAKIEADAARETAKIRSDYNEKLSQANQKALEGAEEALKQVFGPKSPETAEKLFGKVGAATPVQFAKEDADKIGITKKQADIANEILEEASKQKESLSQLTVLFDKLAKAKDEELYGAILRLVSDKGLMDINQEQKNKIEEINTTLANRKKVLDEDLEIALENIGQERIRNLISKKTTEGAGELLGILEKATPFAQTTLTAMEGNAATLKVLNDFRSKELDTILQSQALQDEAQQLQIEKNRNDLIAVTKSNAQVEAQIKLLSSNERAVQLVEERLKGEIIQAELGARQTQLKNEFYSIESNRLALVKSQLQNEIDNLNIENLLKQSRLDLLLNYGKMNEFAAAQIQQNRLQATENLATSIATAEQTGTPESMLDVAQRMAELNKEMGNGKKAMDALRDKLVQVQVNAANLGADLVDIGFDQAKSGLKQLFKDIGSGAKSASEAWQSFGLNLADSLLDRVMDANIDSMLSNLSVAFTGQDLLKDSNLLLKNSVDQLNTTMQTKAINPPTLSPVIDSTKKEFFGGKIQAFNKGGFVEGKPGVDKVPAMLTAGEYVLNKKQVREIMQKFNEGGIAKRIKEGAKGAAQAAVMVGVSQVMGKKLSENRENPPPKFDMTKLDNLNLGSDVNIRRGDPRLSAKFIAEDPVMEEYRDYLLELATYRAQKTNEKFREKQGTLASVMGAAMSFAVSQLVSAAAEPIQQSIQKGKNFLGKTTGKHKEAYKAALELPEGKNLNYRDIKSSIVNSKPISVGGKNWTYSGDSWAIAKKQGGGSIPAMLTAGEGFVPAPIAKRIGYNNLNKMNQTGTMPIIDGPSGVDRVGPVGLSEGDFIIRKSSTDKLLRENPHMMKFALQNPEGFKRGEKGYYEGGMVSNAAVTATQPRTATRTQQAPAPTNRISTLMESVDKAKTEERTQASSNAVTNNINVNVTIDQAGNESVSTEETGSNFEQEKNLSMKIKARVLEVIREEKRIGGELS